MKQNQENIKLAFNQQVDVQKKSIECSRGNQTISACLRQNCQNPAFLCQNKECICMQPHKQCFLQLPVHCIKQFFANKIDSFKKIAKKIKEQIKKIIDQLSEFQQRIVNDVQNSKSYFGFTQTQNMLLRAFRIGKADQIKGKDIYQFLQNLKNSKHNCEQYAQQQIVESFENFKKQIETLKNSIKKNLFSQDALQLFFKSKIIKNSEDTLKMQMFFDNKLSHVQLILRGTRDSFKVAKFHQKCDNISNTLTIIQTTQGKMFGGYTPLLWSSINAWGTDNQLKSFVFQLNNNDKFKLKSEKANQAIFSETKKGPTFGGGHDFTIADDSNINQNSCANIGNSYTNSNYSSRSSQPYTKFSGTYNFKVKQYEVWKIKF